MNPTSQPNSGRGRSALASIAFTALVCATRTALAALPVDTPPPSGDPQTADYKCVTGITGVSFSAFPATIRPGGTASLNWSMRLPRECGGSATVRIQGYGSFATSGAVNVTPKDTHQFLLEVKKGSAVASLTGVKVWVEPVRAGDGKLDVLIDSNEQVQLFVQSVSGEGGHDGSGNFVYDPTYAHGARVRIADYVQLDLSGYQGIQIKPGVQISGGRTASVPGPLLYTTTYPDPLFRIGDDIEPTDTRLNGDNVRISGIRLQGPNTAVTDNSTPAKAIYVLSSRNVQIDNNDIYGWPLAAIRVDDPYDRLNLSDYARGGVRILRNSLHHNQYDDEGYGAEVKVGGYAVLEGNMFDNNRHAIAAGGQPGSGYFFYRNHINDTGGHHAWGTQTHQIDMHGTGDAGYSGASGELMDIRFNSVMYDDGNGVALRGRPSMGMYARWNVFRNNDVWGSRGGILGDGAFYQYYDGTLTQDHNRFDVNDDFVPLVCDFDGDGTTDSFATSGAMWLYRSGVDPTGSIKDLMFDDSNSNGGSSRWRYLNTSTVRAYDLAFGDVNGDGRCDVRVKATGSISLGGSGPVARRYRGLVSRDPDTGQVRITQFDHGNAFADEYHDFAKGYEIAGIADMTDDHEADVLLREKVSQNADSEIPHPLALLTTAGGKFTGTQWLARHDAVGSTSLYTMDFDGDGLGDRLFRKASGELAIDYSHNGAAPLTPDAPVRWRNESPVVGPDWQIKTLGDFDGNGRPDIVWRHDNGQVAIWMMYGNTYTGETYPGGNDPGLTWQIVGNGDFDGDGKADLLWRHTTGLVSIWFAGDINRQSPVSWRNDGSWRAPNEWKIETVADFNGDGRADLLWRRTTDGLFSIWFMDGARYGTESPYQTLDPRWKIEGSFEFD